MADEWHEMATSDHFWIQWRFNRLMRLLPESFKWGQVLDVGCGNAVVCRQIEGQYECIVDGCDLSLPALNQATPGKGRLYYYNIHDRKEDFKGRYDTILCLDVLEHIEDPVNFVGSIDFHLKEGGSIIINVPAFQAFYSVYDAVQGHRKRYNLAILRKELNAAGYRVEDSMYWGMSMAPIVMIRKFIIKFFPKEKIMSMGFKPQNSFVNFMFQSLRRIECGIFRKAPFGTSLMALARKNSGE